MIATTASKTLLLGLIVLATINSQVHALYNLCIVAGNGPYDTTTADVGVRFVDSFGGTETVWFYGGINAGEQICQHYGFAGHSVNYNAIVNVIGFANGDGTNARIGLHDPYCNPTYPRIETDWDWIKNANDGTGTSLTIINNDPHAGCGGGTRDPTEWLKDPSSRNDNLRGSPSNNLIANP